MTETLEEKVERLQVEVSSLRNTLLSHLDTSCAQYTLIQKIADDNVMITRMHDEYFERLHALFHKVFPDHGRFLAEYDRVLGNKRGPQEPKKPPG